MSPTPRYKRILLKLSGEALMGTRPYGLDPAVVRLVRRWRASYASVVTTPFGSVNCKGWPCAL